jgi:TonB family protein
MSTNRAFRGLLVATALSLSWVAHADLYDAGQAYDKKDFEKAFALYRDLAELGEVHAQESLALMYVSGEGVKRDNVLGYAWASIALENGAGDDMKSIIDQLEPHLNGNARKKIDGVREQFGRAALDKSLMPNIFENANYLDREPCRISKAYTAKYPTDAMMKGIQGAAYMELTVMPDGRARNPRVIYSVPANTFDEAAREVVLRTEFTPARTKDGLVPCPMSLMIQYVMPDAKPEDYPKLETFTEKTRVQAEAGDPRSQMLYGLLISGVPQLKRTRSDAMPWFLKSAQAGLPTAQYTVGYSMLQGWGCECDEPKGLIWLHKAAAADQSDAQVALANYLLRGDPTQENVAKARVWLERAAASRNRDGKFYLAALLAASTDAASRDPQRSMSLLHDVMRDMDVDPTAFEIRAAANAMLGKFNDAKKDQARALKMATALGWDTVPQQARLRSYEQNTAWTGDLFAF